MLAIKSLVDGVKLSFVATPTPEKGDFVKSPTAVALGIASVEDINNIGILRNSILRKVAKNPRHVLLFAERLCLTIKNSSLLLINWQT